MGCCAVQYCGQAFLSEAALEAVQAGRADFAATLTEIGLLPSSYQQHMRQTQSGSASQEPHAFDQFCNNARIVKAALCAGLCSGLRLLVLMGVTMLVETHDSTCFCLYLAICPQLYLACQKDKSSVIHVQSIATTSALGGI